MTRQMKKYIYIGILLVSMALVVAGAGDFMRVKGAGGANFYIEDTTANKEFNLRVANSGETLDVISPNGATVGQWDNSVEDFLVKKLSVNDVVTIDSAGNLAGLSNVTVSGVSTFESKIIYNLSRQYGGLIEERPIYTTESKNITVCSSGCDYNDPQVAVFASIAETVYHRIQIILQDDFNNTDLFIPSFSVGDITVGVDGACEAVVIKGISASNRKGIGSITSSGGVGCQSPLLQYLVPWKASPWADENVSIAFYGGGNAQVKYINFSYSTADSGILCYGASVTSSANDFGQNQLSHAYKSKHGGICSVNDVINTGSLTNAICVQDDGVCLIGRDLTTITYVGDPIDVTADDSYIAVARDSQGYYNLLLQHAFRETTIFNDDIILNDTADPFIKATNHDLRIFSEAGFLALQPDNDGNVLIGTGGAGATLFQHTGGVGVNMSVVPNQAFAVKGNANITGTLITGDDITSSADIEANAELRMSDSLTHIGDTDTKIRFGDDRIRLIAGNVEMLDCTESTTDLCEIQTELNVAGISADGTGKAVCIKSDGNLGTCSDAVGASGTCTCV